MSKLVRLAATLLALPAAQPAAAAPASSPRQETALLLAAERKWSGVSSGKDLVSGLEAMFADKVVMPLPTGGFARTKAEAVAALRRNPANVGARARWRPVRTGVSADGRHGFSFGYMTIEGADRSKRYAKYLSYWVKGPEGWRVAAYKRAPSPASEGTPDLTPLVPARRARASADRKKLARLKAGLIAAEQAFSDQAQKVGLASAFRANGRADAMNMGREAAFVIGADAIGAAMPPGGASEVHWAAEDALVASSGDLGVTWGTIRAHAPQPGRPAAIPFFTIWYRADPSQSWKYVAE
jgi:hypothetical protein